MCALCALGGLNTGCKQDEQPGRLIQVREGFMPGGRLESRQEYYLDQAGREVAHGVAESWYENGPLKSHLEFRDGIQHGIARVWHPNGALARETFYVDGKERGLFRGWYEDGNLLIQGVVDAGLREGLWCGWHPNGRQAMEETYLHDTRISRKYWTSTGEPESVDEEQMP